MQQFFNKFALNPKRIFLIDGLGAFLTAFFLFAILRTFNEYFGMPIITLDILSIIAFFFCVYSLSCFLLLTKNWHFFLQPIIFANLLYCFLTSGLVIYYYQQLTNLGITYFLLEIVVVCGLVFFEINVLKILKRRSQTDI